MLGGGGDWLGGGKVFVGVLGWVGGLELLTEGGLQWPSMCIPGAEA